MPADYFLDTNVLIYSVGNVVSKKAKYDTAEFMTDEYT